MERGCNKGLFVKRDLEGGQMSRDMTLYVDDDGIAYHIYSSEEKMCIRDSGISGTLQTVIDQVKLCFN